MDLGMMNIRIDVFHPRQENRHKRVRKTSAILSISQRCSKTIGGSRGGRAGARPLQDPILSFLHTFSLKSAHVGGQNPPKMSPRPPLRKILDPALKT